jgi:glycosyltransferase involved in cell wall biosynthesis
VVLDRADGVICHSRYVERLAREYGFDGPIWVIPMPAWPSIELGARLTPEGHSPIIACLGYLNAAKRVPQLLEAFGRVRHRFPDALLVLAGSVAADLELDRGSLSDGVLLLDHQDERRLWQLLADCDVSVSLRWPTMGETSGMAIRALCLGKPLVVSDVGWFSELPDSVAAKVPVDEFEVETLAAVLELLAGDEIVRMRMSAAAFAYVKREHDLERVADLYLAAVEEGAGGAVVRDSVVLDVARAANEVGIGRNDPQLAEIAARFHEVGLGN